MATRDDPLYGIAACSIAVPTEHTPTALARLDTALAVGDPHVEVVVA